MATFGKLFLIFHGRFPGEKAAAIFTAKSAEAFAELGFEVVVLAPRRLGRSRESPSKYFGTKNNFRVVFLPVVDIFWMPFLKRFAFLKSYVTFSMSVFFYLLFRAEKNDIIYSNEALPLLYASLVSSKTFYEVHDFPKKSWVNKRLFMRAQGIIVTNRWKRDELIKRFRLAPRRVLFEPNAVDAFRFGSAKGEPVRQHLPLPGGTILVGYAGSLKTMGMEKGIELLLKVMSLLSEQFRLLIIGGLREDIAMYQKQTEKLGIEKRVVFAGWMHYDNVPEHLAACDVLVAPFPKTEHYDLYMSPMKLFEYMAVGKPIVASRLRAIEEVVDDSSAFLVEPGSAQALADGIVSAIGEGASLRAERAQEKVADHTWDKRAERIANFIKSE